MDRNSQFTSLRNDILRHLDAIEARLETASRRFSRVLSESVSDDGREGDPVQRLKEIESQLEALAGRLTKLEEEMRWKESPPESFGSESQFSTGPHYPGIG